MDHHVRSYILTRLLPRYLKVPGWHLPAVSRIISTTETIPSLLTVLHPAQAFVSMAAAVIVTEIQNSRADWLKNRSLYDKSMKLGTLLEHEMRIIFSYRAISELTSDLCGSFFFQIADKVINSLLSILFI